MPIVSAQNVSKSFGANVALKGLSFDIAEGECFGLLGPNGAGKSTMIKIIYGVLQRTGGDLSVLGLDPAQGYRRLRQQIGVVLQEDALDEALNVEENMLMFCRYYGLSPMEAKKRVDELFSFMELGGKAKARIGALSGGMKRRLAFVRSLLSKPKLLILDEPTTGLDPAVRQLLWQRILELKRTGTTIILTTHYMDEAEILCDRLAVINQGLVQAEGSPRSLIEQHCEGFVALVESFGEQVRVGGPSLADLTSSIKAQNKIASLVRPANLEDVFLKLTGRDLNV
jgi:lipooligosaccharide transport system ATP-binding protein